MHSSEDAWAKDTSTKNCIGCRAKFSLISRRHHCRSCGEIFCENCSSNTQAIPGECFAVGPNGKVEASPSNESSKKRVCTHCNDIIKQAKAMADKSSSKILSQLQQSRRGNNNGKELSPAAKFRALEEYKVYAHQMLTVSELPTTIRNHKYVTSASYIQRDIEALSQRIRQVGTSSSTTGGESSNVQSAEFTEQTPRTSKSPAVTSRSTGTQNEILLAHKTRGASTEYDRTVEHEQLCIEYEAARKHALDIAHVLKKNSLTSFFHAMHSGLVSFLFKNKLAALAGAQGTKAVGTDSLTSTTSRVALRDEDASLSSDMHLTLNGIDYNGSSPLVAEHFMNLILSSVQFTAKRGQAMTPLSSAVAAVLQLERVALSLTRRYEEGIVCLDEAGADTFAESVLARVCAYFNKMDEFDATEDGGPLLDMICRAISFEIAAADKIPTRTLSTRVPDVDSNWTDEGLISRSGIATPDGLCFELPGLSEASKYYYRQGSVAEAEGLGMKCFDRNRVVPSPILTVQEEICEIQVLVAQRAAVYASYSSCRFESVYFSHWAGNIHTSEDGTVNKNQLIGNGPSPSANNRASMSVMNAPLHMGDSSVDPLARAAKTCDDYLANASIFQKLLLNRYMEAAIQIDALSTKIDRLSLRVADIATGAHVSEDVKGFLTQAKALRENTDPGLKQKAAVFERFRRILSPPHTATLDFYLHLRLKLLTLLVSQVRHKKASSSRGRVSTLAFTPMTPPPQRTANQDDTSEFDESYNGESHAALPDMVLAGVPVPQSSRIVALADEITRVARFNPSTQSWSVADILDRHCDYIARALAERYNGAVVLLSESGVLLFAELCLVRYFHLIDQSSAASNTPLETCTKVDILQYIEVVALSDTFVKWKKAYLPSADGTHTLSEQGLHSKGGLVSIGGEKYIGDENGPAALPHVDLSRFPPRNVSVAPKLHHRPHKYGYLLAWSTNEAQEKKLLAATDEWSRKVSAQAEAEAKKKSRLSFFSRGNKQPTAPVQLIKTRRDHRCLHWGSSLLSAGPRLVVAGDTVGVTLQPRNREGTLLTLPPSKIHYVLLSRSAAAGNTICHRKNTNGDSSAAEKETNVIHGTTEVSVSGPLVVGAVLDGTLLVANVVQVKSALVDWANSGCIHVHPHTCLAGGTISVNLTLRDKFGNLTTSTNVGDFSVNVVNEMQISPSSVDAHPNGSFGFNFIPILDAPIDMSITVGGYCRRYTERPMVCLPAKVDFKSTLLSFDEVEVEAGQTVHGNLLLRDVFGNRAAANENDEPVHVELINGGRTELQVEKVHASEYIFQFQPTRHGTALIRVYTPSNQSASEVMGKLTVHSPKVIDWEHSSTISCISQCIFAGERASFHIIPRDVYGNALSAEDLNLTDFQCALRYEGDPDNPIPIEDIEKHSGGGNTDDGDEDAVEGSNIGGSFISFAAVPTRAGTVVAEVVYNGVVRESAGITIPPASLCWDASELVVPPTAVVGEWVNVQIECYDKYSNPSPAHAADFSVCVENVSDSETDDEDDDVVAVVNEEGEQETTETDTVQPNADGSSATEVDQSSKKKEPSPRKSTGPPKPKTAPRTKTVSGAGCHFGFQFMVTRASNARVSVTYVGHHTHTSIVDMKPAVIDWAACTVMTDTKEVLAGEDATCTVTFRDTFGNLAPAPTPETLLVRAHNQGEVLDITETTPIEVSEDTPADEVFAKMRFVARPKKMGHMNFTLAMQSKVDEQKKTAPLTVAPNKTHWASCVLSNSASDGRVIAGLPVSATMQLFDRHGNPSHVSNLGEFVEFVAYNIPAVDSRRSCSPPSAALTGAEQQDEDTANQPLPIPSDASLAISCSTITRPSPNSLSVQAVPERTGQLVFVARAVVEGKDGATTVTDEEDLSPKQTRNDVGSSEVDWLGKTQAIATEQVVAGKKVSIVIHLRDAFDNPVHDLKPSQLACVIDSTTRNPLATEADLKQTITVRSAQSSDLDDVTSLHEQQQSAGEDVDDNSEQQPPMVINSSNLDEASDVMICEFVPEFSGMAQVTLELQGVQRVPIPVKVVPAPAAWDKTELEWLASLGIAGTASQALLRMKDAFGNITTDGHPKIDTVSAKGLVTISSANNSFDALPHSPRSATAEDLECHAASAATEVEATVVPHTDNTDGTTPFVVNCTSNHRGEIVLCASLEGDETNIESSSLQVDPAPLLWEKSTFVWDAYTLQQHEKNDAASILLPTAGSQLCAVLTLRDAFNNRGFGLGQDINTGLTVSVVAPNNCCVTPAYTIQPVTPTSGEGAASADRTPTEDADVSRCSDFIIGLTATVAGSYALKVGLPGANSEEFKTLSFTVKAGTVSWPLHCKCTVDAETVEAGTSAFFELHTNDEYGNPTNVGVDLAKLCVLMAEEALNEKAGQSEEELEYPETPRSSNGNVTPREEGGDKKENEADQTTPTKEKEADAKPQTPTNDSAPASAPPSMARLNYLPQNDIKVAQLPHQPAGLFSFTFEPKRCNLLHFAVQLTRSRADTEPHRLLQCDASPRVVPSAPDWTKSMLIASDEAATVDQCTYLSMVVCDAFGNAIPVGANSLVEEQLLQKFNATNNGDVNNAQLVIFDGDDNEAQETFKRHAHPHASRILSVTAFKTGTLQVVASHADSSESHTVELDVLAGGIQTAQCVFQDLVVNNDTNVTCGLSVEEPHRVVAGNPIAVQFTLQDKHENMVSASIAQLSATCRPVEGSTEEVRVELSRVENGGDNVETPSCIVYTMNVVPTVAVPHVVSITGDDDTGAGGPPTNLGSFYIHVNHAKPHAPKCAFAVKAETISAGDTVTVDLMLYDPFGNVVQEFAFSDTNSATTDGKLTAKNGTTQPLVTLSSQPETQQDGSSAPATKPPLQIPDGNISLMVRPCEIGQLHLEFTTTSSVDANGSLVSTESQKIAVTPAGVHWPSCTLKIVEDQVKLGEEATIIITAKDQFGNNVAAEATDFEVNVVGAAAPSKAASSETTNDETRSSNASADATNNGSDADSGKVELHHMGKTFVGHFKPLERGPLQFDVRFKKEGSRRTDPSRVV